MRFNVGVMRSGDAKARKEGLGGDNDLLRRNWVSQATGHAISRYQARPAFVCLAVSPVLHMQPGISGD